MKQRSAGFTLIEVLVTIAVVATLAAVLLPALARQMSRGDAGRASSDLVSVQRGVIAFSSDVHRYPKTLGQLVTAITTSDQDILDEVYTTSNVTKWKGPYIATTLSDGTLLTAFGASVGSAFGSTARDGADYLTAKLSPITESDFNKIDEVIDDVISSSTGDLTYSSTPPGTATFFLIPIQ